MQARGKTNKKISCPQCDRPFLDTAKGRGKLAAHQKRKKHYRQNSTDLLSKMQELEIKLALSE